MSDEKVDQVGWRLEVKIGKIKYIRVRIKFMFGSLRESGTGGTVFYHLHGHSTENHQSSSSSQQGR